MELGELNRAPAPEARRALIACCASGRWADAMTTLRPFSELAHLLAAAEEVWWDLTPDDWLEAFSAHPRIGESAPGDDTHSRWSRGEQAGAAGAGPETRRLLAECNEEYEERFGYTFIVFASGHTAEEMLDLCRARLDNDEIRELTVAAAEQARITNLRLRKLVEAA